MLFCPELSLVGLQNMFLSCILGGLMLSAALGFPYCRSSSWPFTSHTLLWCLFWDVVKLSITQWSCCLFCPSVWVSYRCALLLLAPLWLPGLASVSSMDNRCLFLSACSHMTERMDHKWRELCGHHNLALLIECACVTTPLLGGTWWCSAAVQG